MITGKIPRSRFWIMAKAKEITGLTVLPTLLNGRLLFAHQIEEVMNLRGGAGFSDIGRSSRNARLDATFTQPCPSFLPLTQTCVKKDRKDLKQPARLAQCAIRMWQFLRRKSARSYRADGRTKSKRNQTLLEEDARSERETGSTGRLLETLAIRSHQSSAGKILQNCTRNANQTKEKIYIVV